MKRRVEFALIFALVILALVACFTPAHADGGVGLAVLKPFTGGPWSSTSIAFNWSVKLTAEPSWGVWADGIVVPEGGNAQAGIGIAVNLGEAADRWGVRISPDFKGILDRAYVGGAALTDKLDFNDWSHWCGGFYGKYTLVSW